MKNETETRIHKESPVVSDPEKRTISGYGAVFNSLSRDLGGFREEIDPGAFTRTLNNTPDIMVALNHDVLGGLLGRTSSGTAKVYADQVGVRYEVQVPNTSAGNDALELASRGDLPGSSFTFALPKGGSKWRRGDDGDRIRRLTEVRLFELGPVASPAYLDTTVAVRSLEQLIDEEGTEQEEEEGTRLVTVSDTRRILRITR